MSDSPLARSLPASRRLLTLAAASAALTLAASAGLAQDRVPLAASTDLAGVAADERLATPATTAQQAGPQIVKAVSRLPHGEGGSFDLDLPLTGVRAIEPRSTAGGLTLVTFFDRAPGDVTAAVEEGDARVTRVDVRGQQVSVELQDLADAQYVTLVLGSGDVSHRVTLGLLAGDVSQNRVVNAGDSMKARGAAGRGLDQSNFLSDVNRDGVVGQGDAEANRAAKLAAPAPRIDLLADAGDGKLRFTVDDYAATVDQLDVSFAGDDGTVGTLEVEDGVYTLAMTGPPSSPSGSGRIVASNGAIGASTPVTGPEDEADDEVVLREVWTNVSGNLDDFNPNDRAPDHVETLRNAVVPPTGETNFIDRITGVIVPTYSGDYTFYLAADDQAVLRISANDEPGSKYERSRVPSFTNEGQFAKFAEQRSRAIRMEAGEEYYFEILRRQYTGDDHLALGWQQPNLGGPGSETQASRIQPAVTRLYEQDAGDDGSMLYLSSLRPPAGVASYGSGLAKIEISADGQFGAVDLDLSNLAGDVNRIELRHDNGQVIEDLTNVTPNAQGKYVFQFAGTFGPAKRSAIERGEVNAVIGTTANATELTGDVLDVEAAIEFVPPAPAAAPNLAATDYAVHRLLTQATFGPTPAETARVKSMGIEAWVDEQLNTPWSSHIDVWDPAADPAYFENWWLELRNAYYERALNADDQLRQRVAFALSEMFVVSIESGLIDRPKGTSWYYDRLGEGAFGNFRDLLEDVTLSPAMGRYLNMVNNKKANTATGRVPNENYAREIVQLFSIGTVWLHPDGTPILGDDGMPVETYDQPVVEGLARVCTGWTFDWASAAPFGSQNWKYVDLFEMVPRAQDHEPGDKLLLHNIVQPASQGARPDLDAMHDLIFEHPNIGPFVAKHLIQRLVTSNPSPAYVYRVASTFDDNGSGVRGDMKAVVRAVLMDPEARSPLQVPGYGKLREPHLRWMALARTFGLTAPYPPDWYDTQYVGQAFLASPTVFNFFSPTFTKPGVLADNGLVGPEFELWGDSTSLYFANSIRWLLEGGVNSRKGGTVRFDVAELDSLADNPGALVDEVSRRLTGRVLPSEARNAVISAVNGTSQGSNDWRRGRVRDAVQLITISPYAAVETY